MTEQDLPVPAPAADPAVTEPVPAVTGDTLIMPAAFGGASDVGLPLEPPPASVLVAVKVAGRDTVMFPAIRDEEPEPCRCGTRACPDRDRSQDPPMPAETRAVLSCGPGVVSKIWRLRVRNGQWDDIRAIGRTARRKVHDPAEKRQGEIHNDLDCGWHDIAAVFRAHPAILPKARNETFDRALSEVAASLESGLAEMRRVSAERWGAAAGRAA